MTLSESIKKSCTSQAYLARLLWPHLCYGSQRNKMNAICSGKNPVPDELKKLLKQFKIKYDAPKAKNK